MDEDPPENKGTVRLDMDALYREAVDIAGREEADRLWDENRLNSKDEWPGKWATAMEILERLRATMADQ